MKNWKINKSTSTSILALAGLLALCCTAIAAPLSQAPEGDPETMWSLIKKGGPVMIPLAIGSILALAIAVERFISLRRDSILPPQFMDGLMNVWKEKNSVDDAVAYCEKTGGAVGNIFSAGMLRIDWGGLAVEKAIEDAGAREASKMKRSLKGLSFIATVSPLLGLLGTVYGMIRAFQTASAVGMGKADVLARGIYEALVTTAAGLTIAIPVLFLFQLLSTKVNSIVDELDDMGMKFVLSTTKPKK